MTIKRILVTCAVTMAATVSAAALWFAGAGTALAPEPAELMSPLQTSTAPVLLIHSRAEATAYFLSSTNWTYRPSLPAGTPCSSTANRPKGTLLSQVVVASGSYRKCQ